MLPLRATALLLATGPLLGQGTADNAAPPQHFDPTAADWVSLFDGKTMDGWTTTGGRYDGNARWSIEDGTLTGREGPKSAGGLIYTEAPYRNFAFTCETKITYPFDSGVFLRMLPRKSGLKGMQVTLDHRPGGEIAGIYADGWLKNNPEGEKLFRKDDWNRVEVLCTESDHCRVQVWINGTAAMDYRLPEKAEGYASMGLIGLQVHGARNEPENATVKFRDIRVRRLPGAGGRLFDCDERGIQTLTDQGRKAGWTPLFNGINLSGWRMVGGKDGQALGAVVRDGVIAFTKEGPDGYLRTEETFEDFELTLDFRIGFMANSGLFLRGDPKGGSPAWSGCEIQIIDDFNWERVTKSKLAPYQFTGGLYGSVAASANKPYYDVGHWNTYRVHFKGSQIRAYLNSELLYDIDTHKVPVPKGQKPFAERARAGFIGLQRHAPAQAKGDYAFFRNVFVRRL